MKPGRAEISEFTLERYVAGELSQAEAKGIEAAAFEEPELAARIEAIRESNVEILHAYPSSIMAKRIAAKSNPARGRVPPFWALSAAALLVVGIGLGLTVGRGLVPGASGLDDTRAKGSALHLSLYKKAGTEVENLADGARVRTADLLQIGYHSGAKGYGAIFSIDGRGTLTFHLPAGYSGGDLDASAIENRGENLLPAAYELDDAPRFERFFFVFSTTPFRLASLEERARRLARDPLAAETGGLELPAGLSYCSFIVKKGVRQ